MRGVWRARAMKANKIRRKVGCVPEIPAAPVAQQGAKGHEKGEVDPCAGRVMVRKRMNLLAFCELQIF